MGYVIDYGVTPENEAIRIASEKDSFTKILGNTSLASIKPNPHPCKCGAFPYFNRTSAKGAEVSCNGCKVHYKFKGNYNQTIFEWNLAPNVPFHLGVHKILPYIDTEYSFDNEEIIITKIKDVKSISFGLASHAKLSNEEKILIKIIKGWSQYARKLIELRSSAPDKFFQGYSTTLESKLARIRSLKPKYNRGLHLAVTFVKESGGKVTQNKEETILSLGDDTAHCFKPYDDIDLFYYES